MPEDERRTGAMEDAMKGAMGASDAVTRVHVRVPATSANLGAGFDTYGLALQYYDELTFTVPSAAIGAPHHAYEQAPTTETASNNARVSRETQHAISALLQVHIEGEGASELPKDGSHLVVKAFRKACAAYGLPADMPLALSAHNRIPQERGMGSSAAAIVAGVAAAYAMSSAVQSPVNEDAVANSDVNLRAREAIFHRAAAIEGHPDNVAPAVFGGLTASWKRDEADVAFSTVRYQVSSRMRAMVFVPDVQLATSRARQALPQQLDYAQAITNISRASLLPAAMNPALLAAATVSPQDLLYAATQDRVHQPYRMPLMPASGDLVRALREQDFAAAISGAGTCVIVLHDGDMTPQETSAIAAELAANSAKTGVHWRNLQLPLDTDGVQWQVERGERRA